MKKMWVLALLIPLVLTLCVTAKAADFSTGTDFSNAQTTYGQSENSNFWYVGADSATDAVYAYLTTEDEGATYALYFVGSGYMKDFAAGSDRGWNGQLSKITEVSVADGIKSIGKLGLAHLTAVNVFDLPDSIETLGEKALAAAGTKDSFELGPNVSSIGSEVFIYTKFANITVDSNNQYFKANSGGILYSADGKELITSAASTVFDSAWLQGVENIWAGAFRGAGMTGDVIIPNTVKTIGASAFSQGITAGVLQLADSVTSIGNEAFWQSTFTHVYIPTHTILIGSSAFNMSVSSGIYVKDIESFTNLNGKYTASIPVVITNGGTVDLTKTGFAAVSQLGKVAKWYEYSESATNNFGDPAPAAPAANKTYIVEWIDSVYTVPATLELDAFTEGATPAGKELSITLNDGATAGAGDLTAVSDSPAAITAAVADGKVTVTAASNLTAGNYGAVVTVTTLDGAVHEVTVTLTVNAKPASRPTTTPSTNNTIQSPKTFDAGVAVYAAMALTSAAGAVWVTKKHH